jgi:DNA-3-methyladenine glycosylase II
VRAVLGQLVSVAMAAPEREGRLGGTVDGRAGLLSFPSAQRLAQADPLALKALGMPCGAEALIHLAQAAIRGDLPSAPENIDAGIKQLQTLPGLAAGRRTTARLAGAIFCG